MAPDRRRAELIEAAATIAVSEGLDRLTAKRVAMQTGVFPGLVSHYFTADELVAAAFGHTASAERDELYANAQSVDDPVQQMGRLLAAWLRPERDAVSLLWIDAWQAGRRRPTLRDEVGAQMREDVSRLGQVIQRGIDSGQFTTDDAESAAMRIMSLVDGISVQAAVRGVLDYEDVRTMFPVLTEQILGLAPATLDVAAEPRTGTTNRLE